MTRLGLRNPTHNSTNRWFMLFANDIVAKNKIEIIFVKTFSAHHKTGFKVLIVMTHGVISITDSVL